MKGHFIENNQITIILISLELVTGQNALFEIESSLSIPVFSSPAFDETHANSAHPGQLIYSLKALVHRLCQ